MDYQLEIKQISGLPPGAEMYPGVYPAVSWKIETFVPTEAPIFFILLYYAPM